MTDTTLTVAISSTALFDLSASNRIYEEQGLEAYRVAALVDGRTWHRVRIGGFDSRARAEKARASLAERLATPDLVLAAAP